MTLRALLLATLLALPGGDADQTLSVLRIKVVVVDAAQRVIPVARHALLISDNPPSAAPRRVITAADGTANVRLRPGNYTVESDLPVSFEGNVYQWVQTLDIVAEQEATLELTADNAEVAPDTSGAASASRLEDDPSALLTRWQASVVEIWTPTAHASGFVIDARGLIATNQRAIGTATSVEVQVTRLEKVAATVIVADRDQDVAILRIDARTAGALPAVPIDCSATSEPPIVERQEIVALQAPLAREKGAITGDVSRVRATVIESDLEPATGGAGGPVFVAGGTLVGITAAAEENADRRREDARVVRIGELCDVVVRAQKRLDAAAAPDGRRLPVDPVQALPLDALKALAERGSNGLRPYQLSSSEFDLALMTPLQVYAARGRPADMFAPESRDFANWSEYVATLPSVLLIRVSPKFEEGFWARVGRAAASTQGVSLPPLKRFKSGFSRLRALCGDQELTPIHAFIIEQRISEKDTINEGLYAFDPGAFEPGCASVTLLVYPDKERARPDTVVVAAKVIQ